MSNAYEPSRFARVMSAAMKPLRSNNKYRRLIGVFVCCVVPVVWLARGNHASLGGGISSFTRGSFGGVGKVQMGPDDVIIYEEGTHDEVVGAVAASLNHIGIRPIYDCHFRYRFQNVLEDTLGYELTVENPHAPVRAIEQRIADDTIRYIVLTTCQLSLKRMRDELLASSAHIICIIHHGGHILYTDSRPLIEPFVEQGRLSVVVLGDHVRKNAQADVFDWAEKDYDNPWGNMFFKTLIPIFDYPALKQRPEPSIWPSQAIVQGNIVKGRRNYDKLFAELMTSISADPALWGYNNVGPGLPFEPQPELSPFIVNLVGQVDDRYPVPIPPELTHVVLVNSSLEYETYYKFISEADIMVPAFAQRAAYEVHTSSSIATAVITRIPVLASPRLLAAYDYISGPAEVFKPLTQTDGDAIAEWRARGPRPRASDSEWRAYHKGVMDENARMWLSIFNGA